MFSMGSPMLRTMFTMQQRGAMMRPQTLQVVPT
jgi:hypothetical protein